MKTSPLLVSEKKVQNEIMSTDVFVKVCDNTGKFTSREVDKDVDACFTMFSDFEKKYSRFLKNNALADFNSSEKTDLSKDTDLLNMISLSQKYSQMTGGVFDITILPDLINEGYEISKKEGYRAKSAKTAPNSFSYKDIYIERTTVTKPKGLKIDLGGIGKGYIIDKVSAFLRAKYTNFLVFAGGDIYFSGHDLVNNYEYWASDLENPKTNEEGLLTFTLSNKSIATSGINRRNWIKDGKTKNHLINPKTHQSVSGDIVSATVVSDTTTDADALAKSMVIMGTEKALDFSNKLKIATLIVDKNVGIHMSPEMEKYVWKE